MEYMSHKYAIHYYRFNVKVLQYLLPHFASSQLLCTQMKPEKDRKFIRDWTLTGDTSTCKAQEINLDGAYTDEMEKKT